MTVCQGSLYTYSGELLSQGFCLCLALQGAAKPISKVVILPPAVGEFLLLHMFTNIEYWPTL